MFADRPIYMYFLFPVPARIFVLITGAITLLLSVTSSGGQMAHLAHLGGLVTGWVLLMRGRGGLAAELKYRYTKWRLQRARRRFDVHQGGRGGGGTCIEPRRPSALASAFGLRTSPFDPSSFGPGVWRSASGVTTPAFDVPAFRHSAFVIGKRTLKKLRLSVHASTEG